MLTPKEGQNLGSLQAAIRNFAGYGSLAGLESQNVHTRKVLGELIVWIDNGLPMKGRHKTTFERRG